MLTLGTAFEDQVRKVLKTSKITTVVNEDNVYQEGDPDVLAILDEMTVPLLLPGSALIGLENLEELYDKAISGKSCLLLVEHYSNMDLCFVSLLSRMAGGRGKDIGNSIIAMAGMKLNEDNPIVAAFTGAYNKIVIYPSRYLQDADPEKDKAEILRSNTINRAAMKSLIRHKYKGHLILVFPSGTRYRPGDPSTKKGVREIDSYIRSFDYMCFVAINGNALLVQETDMMNDIVQKDVIFVTAGPVVNCNEFRDKINAASVNEEDKKQAVADAIMNELEIMHTAAEVERQKLLKK